MTFDDAIAEIEGIVAGGDRIHLSEEQLLEIGNDAIGIIFERTQRGVDADHKRFEAYSPDYAKQRASKGLSDDTVNLDLKGHMLAAMVPIVDPQARTLEIGFLAEFEAKKAAWHSGGVDKNVAVRPHKRLAFVDVKTGKRVSAKEAAKDKRRKKPRTQQREETIELHVRRQRLPKREFFAIRHPDDEKKIEESVAAKYLDNIAKRIK